MEALLSPRARAELRDAARFIAAENPDAARALRTAVAHALRRIGERPRIAPSRPSLAPGHYRFLPVRGFPYLIVYDAGRMPPVVARVVHMARDLPAVLAGMEEG